MARGKRSTKGQVAERVKECKKRILRGESAGEIIRFISERHSVTTRQAENYLAKANEEIRVLASIKGEALYNVQMSRLVTLYNAMLNAKQYGNALATVKEISKLGDLYEPLQVTHDHNVTMEKELADWIIASVNDGEFTIEEIADTYNDEYAMELFPDWSRAVE